MMPQFEIEPHVGVGPVKLGMNRQQVYQAIESYVDSELDQAGHPTLDYAFGNSLQIEYSANGLVQFIGVSFYDNCGCDYTLFGRHIGDFSAEELFRKLAELDGDATAPYNAVEFYFRKLRMTVWEADEQYDCRGGGTRPVYGQVGIASHEFDAET